MSKYIVTIFAYLFHARQFSTVFSKLRASFENEILEILEKKILHVSFCFDDCGHSGQFEWYVYKQWIWITV